MMSKRLFLITLVTLLVFGAGIPLGAGEESGENITLEDIGLRLVSMRNDTSLDTNDDGQADSFRVVIVLNATSSMADINMVLRASTGPRTIVQWLNTSIEGQENFTIGIDSWEVGQYSMTLEMYDPQTQAQVVNLDLGSYWFEPALALPNLQLSLSSPAYLQTGDSCTISRTFTDEVGQRYGMMGSRTFSGAPFQIYDSDDILDCSIWPAGTYSLSENYQNGLGQVSLAELTFSISNRPAPSFNLSSTGGGGEVGTTCTVTIQPTTPSESITEYRKEWEVIPNQVLANVSSIDCSDWTPGIHKVVVKVTNTEGSSTTRGINVVRLPPLVVSENQSKASETWPSRSLGSEVEQEQQGWMVIAGVSLVAFLLTFVVMRRNDKDEDMFFDEIGAVSSAQEELILSDGLSYVPPTMAAPDSDGLPTYTDEEGITWRQHSDGQVDWWDYQNLIWIRFE